MSPRVRFVVTSAAFVALAGCGPKSRPAESLAAENRPSESAPPPANPPARAMQVVNATILANHCQDLGRANSRLAEAAMYRLVEGCRSVPGGSTRFEATLTPGGTIAIAGAPGQPDVVPICILKHSLTHRVALAAPCRLDVKLEESSVPATTGPSGTAP